MRELNYKNKNDIVTPIEVGENVAFSVEDHSEELGFCWLRFVVGMDFNSCSYIGPLYFNTSSKNLLVLAKKFTEWSDVLKKIEDNYQTKSDINKTNKQALREKALDKLTDEDKKILNL